ncbi:MAG TPA: polysaccharide biosynthesis C-terminal domain-containing protein [Pyrinomonadaceae bacterium]|nr:polysaccharide biosynthesis C-terminal domain-containing protein [Pyrinomonadaceae bacterium]
MASSEDARAFKMGAVVARSAKAGAREFVLDTAVVAATQLLLKVRGLVAIPMIVKVLGTAQYGVWVQTLALVDFTGSLVGLNLYHPLVRFLAAKPADGKSVYSTLMTATLITSAAGGLLFYVAAGDISRVILGDAAQAWVISVGGLLVLCYNVRQLNLNAYRATGRLTERSVLELLSTFGQLAGIRLLLWRGSDLLGIFIFMGIWEAAFALLLSAHVVSLVGWGPLDKGVLSKALRYALPLLPAGLSIWMLDRSDRLILGYYLGPGSVGVYSAGYALASLLMLLQTPLQITLFPKVSALWDSDRATAVRYVSLSNKLFLTLAIPFVVGVPVVASRVLSRLGNEELGTQGGGVLTLLVAAGVMLWGVSIMMSQLFYGARRTLPVGFVTVGAAALNLLLNLLLVPLWGTSGAAFSTLVAYLAACLVFYLLSRSVARLNFYWLHLLKCAAAALVMGAVLRAATSAWHGAIIGPIVVGLITYFALLWLLRAVSPAEIELVRGLFRTHPARGRS